MPLVSFGILKNVLVNARSRLAQILMELSVSLIQKAANAAVSM